MWEQAEDTDSIVDIQLELDAGAPDGEGQQQHMGVSQPVYTDTPDTKCQAGRWRFQRGLVMF